MSTPNARCQVCGKWFFRKPGTRQIYDTELCKKTGARLTNRAWRRTHKNA